MVIRLPHRTVRAVNRATIEWIHTSGLPFKTITWHNGTEFHGYRQIEKATGVQCYFAYPHHPWERGSNENANILIRRWLPKGTKLSEVSQAEIKQIQIWMNNYPRMVLGGRCANTALAEWMAREVGEPMNEPPATPSKQRRKKPTDPRSDKPIPDQSGSLDHPFPPGYGDDLLENF